MGGRGVCQNMTVVDDNFKGGWAKINQRAIFQFQMLSNTNIIEKYQQPINDSYIDDMYVLIFSLD